VFAHEIVTARPYAFLDDEEFQNRRVNAVNLRRGLAVDLSSIGRLEADAIARVHDEIVPDPTSADDLHDLLSSLVVSYARPEWRDRFDELTARGRAVVIERDGAELWCTTESRAAADGALAGDDDAVTTTVRGHLELAGVTTVDALAWGCGLSPGRVASGLAALEQEGFALRGRYTAAASDDPAAAGAVDGATEEEWPAEEWVARRLLARMHSYSRRARRERVEPATAQEFMRFVLRWQHLAPGTQLTGDDGLRRAIEQLQGWEAAAAAWELELLARRVRRYDPGVLDRLCHDGEVGWLRLAPRPRDPDAPAGAPNKATPISVVFRDDLGWLLEAARAGADPAEPTLGATAEVAEVLRERGACFAVELGEATHRLPEDVERALWDGVARGLFTSDGFGAIRSRVGRSARGGQEAARLSRLMRGARPVAGSAGRWSLVPASGADIDRDDLAEAVAALLLERWGVVFRDLALRESIRFPWRDVQRALRRLEDRGLVRGGRFVSGPSGEQYALPAAVEQLAYARKLSRTGERVTVNATDPVNLVGVILPGAAVPAVRTNRIVYVDGVPAGEAGGPDPSALVERVLEHAAS
jgi:ATP-dependent Lhr-like helicase